MDLDKLIYEVREATSSISDDRRIDERYITHIINGFRADILRKLIARKPYYNTSGLTQDLEVPVTVVNRSVLASCPMHCTIMRSVDKIPDLVYEGTLGNWFDVKSADVVRRYFELVEPERVGYLTFEFNVLYTFLNTDYYQYFLVKDGSKELRCAIISGIFEDPLEVDPDLTDYPIKQDLWSAIKPNVINAILQRPPEDPVNNSEPDRGEQNSDDRRRTQEAS